MEGGAGDSERESGGDRWGEGACGRGGEEVRGGGCDGGLTAALSQCEICFISSSHVHLCKHVLFYYKSKLKSYSFSVFNYFHSS